MKELLVDGEVYATGEMLTCDEIFDRSGDETLFVDVNERLKLHGWWKGRK